jgi:hypothetical protein
LHFETTDVIQGRTIHRLLDWVSAARRDPLIATLETILQRVPFLRAHAVEWCLLAFNGVPSVPPAMLRGPGSVRLATPDDIERLVRFRDKRDAFLERFAAGNHCLLALVGDEVVGHEWFSVATEHRDRLNGYSTVIPEGFVYVFDGFIAPAYRNAGLWLKFKACLAGVMRETGKTGILVHVERGNDPSFKAHLRFGFAPMTAVFILGALDSYAYIERPSLTLKGDIRKLALATPLASRR